MVAWTGWPLRWHFQSGNKDVLWTVSWWAALSCQLFTASRASTWVKGHHDCVACNSIYIYIYIANKREFYISYISKTPNLTILTKMCTTLCLTYLSSDSPSCWNLSWPPGFFQVWSTSCSTALNTVVYRRAITLPCINLFTYLTSLLNY